MRALALFATCATACSHSAPTTAGDDASTPIDDGALADAAPVAMLGSTELCKLLSNHDVSDPTPNDVQHRSNLLGADLGIPVVRDDTLFILFGDSIGFAGIWPGNESHPDAVGYAADPASVVLANPALLCGDLRLVSLTAAQSIGPHVNASVVADFAGAAMTAPQGHTLAEYIHNPSGSTTKFPNLPGDFEVPSGAFTAGDSIYVFYTTVVGNGDITMKGSYLAKWTAPTPTTLPSYQILYQVDERFDGNGALHGHFINIAAQVAGDYVYVFGTGAYRASRIYVARKRLDALATPGGFEELGTIATTAGYGETSVRYFPSIDRWMLLAEELTPLSNHIVASFAHAPEGPWSAPVVVHDMGDGAFRHDYCCATDDHCEGEQMFNCDKTGFYGTYLLPELVHDAGTFTVTYTMSSFSPYNVALFQTTFAL